MDRNPGAVMGRDFNHISRRCERAVVTAYRELRESGADDSRHSGPARRSTGSITPASPNEARRLVSEWIDHHIVLGATSPAPGCDYD